MSKRSKSYALSEDDIRKALNGDVDILGYADLGNYQRIEDVFRRSNNVVILYINSDTNSGHWTLLTKYPDRISFFDSYGGNEDGKPDSEFKYIDKKYRFKYNYRGKPYLSSLLQDYARRGGTVEYNENQLQSLDEGTATCGRHCIIKTKLKNIPLKKYAALLRGAGDPDEVVTKLTNKLF